MLERNSTRSEHYLGSAKIETIFQGFRDPRTFGWISPTDTHLTWQLYRASGLIHSSPVVIILLKYANVISLRMAATCKRSIFEEGQASDQSYTQTKRSIKMSVFHLWPHLLRFSQLILFSKFRSIRRGDLAPLGMLDVSHGIDSDGHRIQLIRARMVAFNNTAVIVKEYTGRDRQKVWKTKFNIWSDYRAPLGYGNGALYALESSNVCIRHFIESMCVKRL